MNITENTEFSQYRRKQIAELRPYGLGEDITGVSVSTEDSKAGSPRLGDMIARNPKNHADQWLVAAQYFADNFEALSAALPLTASPADPTSDAEQAAYWKGAYDRMAERNSALSEALNTAIHALDDLASGTGLSRPIEQIIRELDACASSGGNSLVGHKWLDPECATNGCQSLVWQSRYESAVIGRAAFRRAYGDMRKVWKIAEDTLAVISGERTPQRFPESSRDLAGRSLKEARFALASAEPAPARGEVAVKALGWYEDHSVPPTGECLAPSPVGRYCIPLGRKHYTLRFRDSIEIGTYPTLEAAKAAAQADFDKRIRSTLASAEPVPAMEGEG